MDMDGRITGARIRMLRKSHGMTQEMLAEAADMSVNYLSNVENGHDICGTRRLLAIANALEASMDYLLADNLAYNRLEKKSEPFEALMNEIARMDAAEQRHLLRYIRLLQQERQEDAPE